MITKKKRNNIQASTLQGGKDNQLNATRAHETVTTPGYKPKDLIGIPWQLAFALRADGWYLRSEIIWHKPNPMPESVRDRPTKSHEQIFLLTKSPRYYYDYQAIMTPSIWGVDKTPDGWDTSTGEGHGSFHKNGREKGRKSGNLDRKPRPGTPDDNSANQNGSVPWEGAMANKRTVWTVPTQPFKEAHFATFPQKLIIDCIKAGTSEHGCCSQCGAPYARESSRIDQDYNGKKYGDRVVAAAGGVISGGTEKSTLGSSNGKSTGRQKTLGWMATCACNESVVPCVCLDPFMGSGTTAIVARKLGRDYLGFELNPDYRKMAMNRIDRELGMFA